jgi:1-acyl-sn-glycerol-3-phosphate acyltransferase
VGGPGSRADAATPGARAAVAAPLGRRIAAAGGRRSIGLVCRRAVTRAEVRVEGVDHLPATGPVLLVARHVHHLLDGCVLWQALPRPFKVLAAADWAAEGTATGRLLGWACRTMGWPTVLRSGSPAGAAGDRAGRVLREATQTSLAILRAGEVLLIFPEAYPAVDPNPTPKAGLDAWLPFRPGFAHLARLAARDLGKPVPVVPVGFAYDRLPGNRWRVVARLGAPLTLQPGAANAAFVARVERRVRELSSS